ncbi:hypothetical protein BLOT_010922 [Blomia tropicalis]|nr:hypothetical protein BLOT_010922 [Blomia tropicalis]
MTLLLHIHEITCVEMAFSISTDYLEAEEGGSSDGKHRSTIHGHHIFLTKEVIGNNEWKDGCTQTDGQYNMGVKRHRLAYNKEQKGLVVVFAITI